MSEALILLAMKRHCYKSIKLEFMALDKFQLCDTHLYKGETFPQIVYAE